MSHLPFLLTILIVSLIVNCISGESAISNKCCKLPLRFNILLKHLRIAITEIRCFKILYSTENTQDKRLFLHSPVLENKILKKKAESNYAVRGILWKSVNSSEHCVKYVCRQMLCNICYLLVDDIIVPT